MKEALPWIALLASCTPSRTPATLGGPGWEQVEDVPPVLPVLPDFAMTCAPVEPATEASPDEAAIFARTGPGAAADGVTTFSKGTDASVMQPLVPADGGDPSIVIVLHRTECFGACPSYHLMLKGDGTFVYVGEHFVNVRGRVVKHCNPIDVANLADRLERLGYFRLTVPTVCHDIATDNPGVWTSVSYGGRTRTIRDYHGNGCMPKQLRKIEDEIDRAAGAAALVACPSGECKR